MLQLDGSSTSYCTWYATNAPPASPWKTFPRNLGVKRISWCVQINISCEFSGTPVLAQFGFLWKTKVFLDLFFVCDFSHFTMVNHHSSPPFVRIFLDFCLLLHRFASRKSKPIPSPQSYDLWLEIMMLHGLPKPLQPELSSGVGELDSLTFRKEDITNLDSKNCKSIRKWEECVW